LLSFLGRRVAVGFSKISTRLQTQRRQRQKNAEVKTGRNDGEYVVFSLATSESWKDEKGDYENGTDRHRVYAWSNLSSFAKTELMNAHNE
jgi:Single-strand binding protein family